MSHEAKAAPDDGPLAYLILPHDVCRGLEDGTLAACWALQASNVLDVSGNLADALRAAEACSWRTGAAVSILAVTVAGTMDAGAQTPAGREVL